MKKKKLKNKIYLYLILILIIIGIISPKTLEKLESINSSNNIEENISIANISENEAQEIKIDKEKLNILYLDVGQADSEIILYKDNVIVIDTGNVNDGEKIIEYLKSLNINKINYLIGTHIHEDHIGSMQYFINEFEIENIYLPYNDSSLTTYYKNLLTNILNKNLEVNEINVGDKINIDEINIEVMAVNNNQPEDENDASIVLELKYNENKFLFTGDATTKVEKERNWNDIDVLKVGHHGSNTSSSNNFLKQVKPEVSIISVGENNSYNLPKEEVINNLEKNNSKVYRTDRDGTIQIVSDGNNYEIYKINRSFDGNKE